jgi:hypothetical protein
MELPYRFFVRWFFHLRKSISSNLRILSFFILSLPKRQTAPWSSVREIHVFNRVYFLNKSIAQLEFDTCQKLAPLICSGKWVSSCHENGNMVESTCPTYANCFPGCWAWLLDRTVPAFISLLAVSSHKRPGLRPVMVYFLWEKQRIAPRFEIVRLTAN